MSLELRYILCSLLLFVILVNYQVSAQITTEQYLYIAKSADRNIVTVVNPRSGEVQSLFSIPSPSYQTLANAYLSPNSEWIALEFARGQRITLAILDLSALTISNVVENVLPPPHVTSLITQAPQNLYWSPDSRYIAFNVYDLNTGRGTVSIYNVETLQTINLLTNDVLSDYQYIWSPDSEALLVVRFGCIASNDCTLTFDTFYPDSGERTGHYVLTLTPYAFDSAICELRWSPDGRYMAYVTSCMTSAFDSTKEVYVLDFNNSQVTEITNFTLNLIPPLLSDRAVVIYADYSLAWYTSNMLLIGVAYGSRLEGGATSIIYDVEAQQSFHLLGSKGEDWELNPGTSLIAYRAVTTDYERRTSHRLDISTLSGTSLQNTISLPNVAACNLAWSPGGTLLMYSKHELFEYSYVCSLPTKQIEFLNVAANQVIYSSPVTTQQFIPLGWMQP